MPDLQPQLEKSGSSSRPLAMPASQTASDRPGSPSRDIGTPRLCPRQGDSAPASRRGDTDWHRTE